MIENGISNIPYAFGDKDGEELIVTFKRCKNALEKIKDNPNKISDATEIVKLANICKAFEKVGKDFLKLKS